MTSGKTVGMTTTQLVSFVLYMFGARFEEHRSSISKDILDSIFCGFSGSNN